MNKDSNAEQIWDEEIRQKFIKEARDEQNRYSLYYKTRFWSMMIAQGTGAMLVIAGAVLSLLGFSGTIEWLEHAHNNMERFYNAGPGFTFIILGILTLWLSRPRPHHEPHAPEGRHRTGKLFDVDDLLE
ncbi:MAG: hypothetical protein AB7T22_08455 [Calditrichaceae bacterium]